MTQNYEPSMQEVKNMPLEIQVAVLYERVGTLRDEVKGLRRALWSFCGAILSGAVLFLFSLASGWIGPKGGALGFTHEAFMMVWSGMGG